MQDKRILKFEVAPAVEVRRDVRRNLPWLLGILGATIAYVLTSSAVIRLFESEWTFLHACYFTVINMTTVGFGDVLPVTHGGKIIAGINALAGLLLFGILVAVLALALQPSSWSASLESAGGEDGRNSPIIDESTERPTAVESGVADLFEGLAKTLRAAKAQGEVTSREGRTRIRVFAHGETPHYVEVYVDIHAG